MRLMAETNPTTCLRYTATGRYCCLGDVEAPCVHCQQLIRQFVEQLSDAIDRRIADTVTAAVAKYVESTDG